MTEQKINFELLTKSASKIKRKALILGSSDSRTLEAVARASGDNIIDPIENTTPISSLPELLKSPDFQTQFNQVDLIIPAYAEYDEFVDIFFKPDNPIFSRRFYAHIGLFETEAYPKPLIVTDSLINLEPGLKEKISLVNLVQKFSDKIGINMPRIALLTAVEAIYPQMQATVDASVIAKMSDRGQIKNCYADGPLSFDIAVDNSAAESKGIIGSEVAGQSDILIAPDIATANGLYHAASQFIKAEIGGMVYGGSLPISHNFPDEPVKNRYNSILLTALLS